MKAAHSLADQLESSAATLSEFPVVTGFDGFVDEMITVVSERKDIQNYDRVDTIATFGDLVKSAAGKSSLREIVVTQTDPGGCAINMGDGLAALGLPVSTFATVGEPVHAAFSSYSQIATLHSWGREPGRTLAYEFDDGKLMHSAVTQLADFTPDYATRCLEDGVFQEACSAAKLIALTDWALYPHMTECWKLLQREVFSQVALGTPFFLDLVDPSSRSEADIRAMLEALPGFEACGPTTLGLNRNEANILSSVIGGISLSDAYMQSAAEQAQALREALGISEVVIHSIKDAVLANAAESAHARGPFCPRPKKSTGAGDRFNAGYALGLLLGLSAESRLLLACAVSGLYVRKGESPSFAELIHFIREWAAGKIA